MPMKSDLYPDAYSEEKFRELLASWSHISKFHESGSVYIYHKGEVFRRHEALSNRPDLINEYFRGNLPVLIDIEEGRFEETESVEAAFLKHEGEDVNPIYWICGVDKLLLGKSEGIFHYLRKRQAENPSTSYVLFFSINFLHPTVSPVLTYTSTFLQNTFITKLHDEAASEYFLRHWISLWKVQMDPKLEHEIVKACKRHFLPLKQAVRFVRDTGSSHIGEILHHDMMRIKLKSIYDGLLPSEQTAIEKIVMGVNDFTPDEAISIDFLKQTEWLESRRNRLSVAIPIFAEYIGSLQRPTKHILFTDNSLSLGGVPIDSMFSPQERSVVQLLVQRMGKIVSRDDVAQAVWGASWREAYSDWAIDQLISRIRKKCLALNVPKSTIQSVKGKGFRYE